jgi:hypothetical protein
MDRSNLLPKPGIEGRAPLITGQRPASYQPRATPWVHRPVLLLQANGLVHKVGPVASDNSHAQSYMPQSLSQVMLHIVFGTKDRRP